MKFELEVIRAVAYGFGAPDPFRQHEPEQNRVESQFYWLEHVDEDDVEHGEDFELNYEQNEYEKKGVVRR